MPCLATGLSKGLGLMRVQGQFARIWGRAEMGATRVKPQEIVGSFTKIKKARFRVVN